MKKKRRIIFIVIILLVMIGLGGLYYIFTNQDEISTLTLVEKQWIDSNKNNLIDFGIVNNVAVINDSGEGLFFDFIESIEKDTGLSFNKVSYEYNDVIKDKYSFGVVDEVKKNDILFYSDNYVLVGKQPVKFNNNSDIKDVTIGTLDKKLDSVNTLLGGTNIKLSSYKGFKELFDEISSETSKVDYIAVPKLVYISYASEYEDLYINYNITDMSDNYVIRLGDTNRLNNIITKYFKKWYNDKYEDLLASEITSAYFNMSGTEKQSEVKFKSKRYTYGFVEDSPFDVKVNGKLVGINSALIKRFSTLADIEISFEEFSSVDRLREAFSQGKIDFYFDKYAPVNYDMDVFKTASSYDEQVVIISKYDNTNTINTINALKGKSVVTLKKSMIEKELENAGVKVKSYQGVGTLLNKINSTSIIAIDEATYNFYKNSAFNEFKVDLRFALDDDYGFNIRSISNNEVFENFFNFYITFVNEKQIANIGYYNAYISSSNNDLLTKVIGIFGFVVIVIIAFLLGSKFMPNKTKKKKITNMKKEDKLKYVDMLTSLKNRNYLNDNIDVWDSSEIYYQAIVIVDLNNIAYINDNYGHQEGDEVIKQAANILIKNQVPNSDIIRTNGNEFLVYLVEYDEKAVITYIKKLSKEFKELSHGFGAAVGYSMITDGIKTIDDAVNEATLDMRNNKEESSN